MGVVVYHADQVPVI